MLLPPPFASYHYHQLAISTAKPPSPSSKQPHTPYIQAWNEVKPSPHLKYFLVFWIYFSYDY